MLGLHAATIRLWIREARLASGRRTAADIRFRATTRCRDWQLAEGLDDENAREGPPQPWKLYDKRLRELGLAIEASDTSRVAKGAHALRDSPQDRGRAGPRQVPMTFQKRTPERADALAVRTWRVLSRIARAVRQRGRSSHPGLRSAERAASGRAPPRAPGAPDRTAAPQRATDRVISVSG